MHGKNEHQVWRKLQVHSESVLSTIIGKNENTTALHVYAGTPQGSNDQTIGKYDSAIHQNLHGSRALNSGSVLF
jgi:hypothetical protein